VAVVLNMSSLSVKYTVRYKHSLPGLRREKPPNATNLMFIIKFLSQHVSGIIMPIIRRIRPCTTAYDVLHWLCWLWSCGVGTQAVCSLFPNSTQPQPAQPVQNIICGSTRSCSPDDGYNGARNMSR